MKCQCCGRTAEVHVKNSSLFTNMPLLVCDECKQRKLEPRWLVVLYGHTYGVKSIEKALKAKSYCGSEISAAELL